MSENILTSVKKVLGIAGDYTAFDVDVLMHINSAFSTLHQLGIGPENGFEVADDSVTWDTYLNGDSRLNLVKTYVYLKVRLLFDPPTTSFHLEAIQKTIDEYEWRINTLREGTAWTDPTEEAETNA